MSSPPPSPLTLTLNSPICIIGTGIAGLINAHILLQDGFTSVTLISRDVSVGGTWARGRVYDGLFTNNVHGEYRYSPLPMPAPPRASQTGGLLSGAALTAYFEAFSAQFLGGPSPSPSSDSSSSYNPPSSPSAPSTLSTPSPSSPFTPPTKTKTTLKAHFLMRTEVLNIRRVAVGDWRVTVRDVSSSPDAHDEKEFKESDTNTKERVLSFARIILATGGNSTPHIPASLSPEAALAAGFLSPSSSSSSTVSPSSPSFVGATVPNTTTGTLICHSSVIATYLPIILSLVPPTPADGDAEIVVVGGGKSAQDICTRLAHEGRKVTMIYRATDAFLASAKPLPEFIRKSRLLSVLTPYASLNTRLERFLHTTTLGSAFVHWFWRWLQDTAHTSLRIPPSSPLRASHSLFWSIRVTDSGATRPDNFASAALTPPPDGKINIMFPRRAVGYYSEADPSKVDAGTGNGSVSQSGPRTCGVVLDDGTKVRAKVVVLATGYKSSWAPIIDSETQEDLGMASYALPASTAAKLQAPWESLQVLQAGKAYRPAAAAYTDEATGIHNSAQHNSSPSNERGTGDAGTGDGINRRSAEQEQLPMQVKAIYRGLVPAKNIMNRDFAIAGTLFSGNMTYSNEVAAHWIASYFRNDRMRLPSSVSEAIEQAEARAVWMQTRFPEALRWANESACTTADLFTWPQLADEMLADMYLPGMRSGGSWYNWIFKTVDLREIENLAEERKVNISLVPANQ